MFYGMEHKRTNSFDLDSRKLGSQSFHFTAFQRGMWERSWLRHYVTSRKVVGSIPDEVIGLLNSFQPHYGPGVDSASNKNAYQESSGGKWRPAHKADSLTAVSEPIV
jgi:hypothetical protein